jgi:hypothetical protein
MTIEKNDQPKPADHETTPLAPGVWTTETSGFAAVPPRAQSDLRDVKDAGDAESAKDPLSPAPEEPRLERYRER